MDELLNQLKEIIYKFEEENNMLLAVGIWGMDMNRGEVIPAKKKEYCWNGVSFDICDISI